MSLNIERFFSEQALTKGTEYFQGGRVLEVSTFEHRGQQDEIRGKVQGAQGQEYEVAIRIWDASSETPKLRVHCTCHAGSFCKHGVAVILAAEHTENPPTPEPSPTPEITLEDPEFYVNLNEKTQYGWFDFELGLDIDGEHINILPLLLRYIQSGRRPGTDKIKITLSDKRIMHIDAKRLKTIIDTLTELYDKDALNKEGRLSFSKQRAVLLRTLKEQLEIDDQHWSGWSSLAQLSQVLDEGETCIEPIPVPKTFHGTLREYQQTGLNWLAFLKRYDLGGILADDMGLGKTIQVLAYLLHLKEQGSLDKPCLVVVPTSLIHNWMSEAQKFAPSLRFLAFHGNARIEMQAQFKDYDVILTSYALMIYDKHLHIAQAYHTIVLDEAQAIKNPSTQTAQVIKAVQAQYRLCLTGTPMENHLGELWSLFHFLMPGFLGSRQHFNRVFRIPIEKEKDIARREQLIARIRPFMLRRSKELVAKDLPPKIHIVQALTLTEPQRDLYEAIRLSMEAKVKLAIQSKGFSSSQIVVLDALLKLRQVCSDPRVMSLDAGKQILMPCKLAWLLETLPTFLEEGRRILLFSSFASILENIAYALRQHHHPYVMLTGSTVDRKTPIDRFQNKEVPIFLISLKAGGVGLNLTAADTIIHYDPWWNPAAQEQASARAHRIGQDKTVFIYQLIAQDTVEDKILAMQDKKAELLSSIMTTETDMTSTFTIEDILRLFEHN